MTQLQFDTNLVVNRKTIEFRPDEKKVITCFLSMGTTEKGQRIINRIARLSDDQANKLLSEVFINFSSRHRNIRSVFLSHYERVSKHNDCGTDISVERQLLIGAYFTQEYSIESAALFNPSIIESTDQSNLEPGSKRIIISFRATGEGHLSSIEFRSGILDAENNITMEPASPYLEASKIFRNMSYYKKRFTLRACEMMILESNDTEGSSLTVIEHKVMANLMARLGDQFSYSQMQEAIAQIKEEKAYEPELLNKVLGDIDWMARSNYDIRFSHETPISERVIFPASENECRGIEDARFVQFTHDDGDTDYFATYTAFDGTHAQSQILETKNFLDFKIRTLNGKQADSKGLALFPRKIDGKYAMISRNDGENLFMMYSSDLHFWHDAKPIQVPEQPWELIQIGNCGSPIETEAGWLMLTHGVGPMRRYCIGATLLDLDDPTKVIGQLEDPLIEPNEHEREGYVPNVVYSCGAIIENDELIIPYAMSDSASSVATVNLQALLAKLTS
jgi:predicted GH43/DUF377 family glycosyl hydrolase